MNAYELLRLVTDAGEYRLADIALRLAAKNEPLFIELASEAGLSVPSTSYNVNQYLNVVLEPHNWVKIRDAYNGNGGGQKVAAIKVARDVCNLGLKDAKDFIEHLMEIGRLIKPEPVQYNYGADDPLRPRW